MANVYDPKVIEPKWQARWAAEKAFEATDDYTKPKFYGLVEFPYPSGAGMHVGHIKAYTSLEVISRKRRMEGYNVLFPMGFDSFGLPAENYAIKTNTHPHIITTRNVEHFKDQMKRVGYSFDWSHEISTSLPDYYKWTQWIFLKMFEHGLVFRAKTQVNYCPHCKVVLSNEDSQGGKCDVCHSDVIQLPKDVWYLKITQYADRLLSGLDTVDYPDSIKQQEIEWIGKSTGAFVNFAIEGVPEALEIYTTRCDTLFGVTFMVMAPEHPLLDKYKDRIENWAQVEAYRAECAKKTEFERTQLVKDKTGVRLQGFTAVNPVNNQGDPHLHRGLRDDGLRHRRHHGRARPRRAGLGVRPEVRRGYHPRHRGRRHRKGRLHRQRAHDQLRLLERLRQQEGLHRRHAPVPGGEGHRPQGRPV